MNEYTKEKLNKLSLVELKVIAKELKISIVGSKSDLIKRILAEFKPQPIQINTHQIKDGKTIIGIWGLWLKNHRPHFVIIVWV